MTEQSNGSRPSREVLDAALVELWAREKRLLAFESELKEVRRAIAVLQKALGGGTSEKAASRNGSGPAPSPDAREEKRARILQALQDAGETMTASEIAQATGESMVGFERMLAAMARAGTIASYAGERYGVKARNGSEPDEDDV